MIFCRSATLWRRPLSLSLVLMPAALLAQASDSEDDELAFELSPFAVETTDDVGYLASNSVSATGLNTPIRDLPMTVQVINIEQMRDQGATDLDEALRYSSGVFTESTEAASGGAGPDANRGASASAERSASASARGSRFANVVNIRGFDVPFQNRLGFRVGGLVITPTTNIALGGLLDASNMERMEVVKGPNSLLYGIGVISGIVNVIPKKPLSEDRYSLNVSVGSDDFFRTTGDVTGPLIHSEKWGYLNYRVIGTYEERGNWTDWSQKFLQYGVGQLDYTSPNRKWNIFLEAQWAETRFEGTGSQWIYDDLRGSALPDFRNEYGEAYNWGREDEITGMGRLTRKVTPPIRPGFPPTITLAFEEADPDDRSFSGGSLPDSYRITGPDTYEEREETNLLLDLNYTPTDRLAFSAGVYYVTQDSEEFDVNVRTINNRDSFNVRNLLTVLPENDPEGLIDLAWGVSNRAVNEADGLDSSVVNSLDDVKLTRYWWSLRPQSSESFQWRAKGTYTFETPFLFGQEATHSLLVGYQYINDNIDFLDGNEGAERAFNRNDALNDALYFRAVDDFSVMRYSGENLAMPADDWRNQDIWFHGGYGVWQGKFFNDRLGLMAGIRYDQYNATTATYDRLSPEQRAAGVQEAGYVDNPFNQTYGIGPRTRNFEKDVSAWSKLFALNFKVTDEFTAYALYSEGLSPNTGLTDGNNETIPAERTKAKEVGVKWEVWDRRISGSIAFYEIERTNAIWNFRWAPAPAKWAGAPNPPTDYAGGAGQFDPSPNPGQYYLSYGIDGASLDEAFVADVLRRATQSAPDPETGQVTFFLPGPDGADGRPIRQELVGLVRADRYSNSSQPFANQRRLIYVDYDHIDENFTVQVQNGTDANGDPIWETREISWREAFETAFHNRQSSADIIGSYDPFVFTRIPALDGEQTPGNAPTVGNSSGANVTFTDIAQGVDFEVVLTPIDNLQIIFNYAHTEREAQGAFNMVDYVDQVTGQQFAGTEYDAIVRIFGREAFGITSEDTNGDGVPDAFYNIRGDRIDQDHPVLPSDAIGGIDGLSLFFQSEDVASMWGKYSFDEGPLENLSLAFGLQYQGPAQTSIAIGGSELGENLFMTPEREERFRTDAAISYTFEGWGASWRLALNVYNLLDDRHGQTTVTYDNPITGGTEVRRTEVFYAPRSFRVSASMSF